MNITDLLSCVLAFFLAYWIRFGLMTYDPMVTLSGYRDFIFIVAGAYVLVNLFLLHQDSDFLTRSAYGELVNVAKMTFYLIVIVLLALNFAKANEHYSRVYEVVFSGCFLGLDFLLRMLVKKYLVNKYRDSSGAEKLVIVTPYDQAADVIAKVRSTVDWRYSLSGLIITDQDRKGQQISGLPVLSNRQQMFDDIVTEDADSVLIVQGKESSETLRQWMDGFRRLGRIVHVEIQEYELANSYHSLDSLGRCPVVTYSSRSPMPHGSAVLRRILDAVLSLLLMPLFGIVFLIVWIFTQLESPGRQLVRRPRVGRNGRLFYQYRFRVMRLDAADRIAAGRSPYTLIGRFLEFTHLDGMPMLINILSAEMSFIGPKAPTLKEFLGSPAEVRLYLCVRPGVVGCWSCTRDQKRARDESEKYLREWSFSKDISILLIMSFRYLFGQSAKQFSQDDFAEELAFVAETVVQQAPLAYDHSAYQAKSGTGYTAYLAVKRTFDIVGSAAAIAVLSPLFLVLTILVIADDGGVPFYGHERVGRDGRRITIYKFRSMRRDAGDLVKLLSPEQQEQYRQEYKIENDPRITRIGSFLRRSSLDELPQLFNILGGSLSFVGPRPVVEEETKIYGRQVAKLLSVKPGLTGYWQAYARNLATYESGRRQQMEMYYVDHQSLWLDLKILWRTVFSVAKQQGAN